MKKQIATLFVTIFLNMTPLGAYNLELNTSYDYFRSLPEGSWNGNSGVVFAGNFGINLYDCIDGQLGGSYGLYNFDGHENLVFKNSKTLLHQAFVTAGIFTVGETFSAGVVYDRQFVNHFGLYDVSTSIDQLRGQIGYRFCSEEVGVWGTTELSKPHTKPLGIPTTFRAISQLNLFWSHFFDNFAMTTLWIGAPYTHGLKFEHETVGVFDAGFSVTAPLTECFYVDAHGAYMMGREGSNSHESRNYASNICVGITYVFGGKCSNYGATYMLVANNANFLIDTNRNQ